MTPVLAIVAATIVLAGLALIWCFADLIWAAFPIGELTSRAVNWATVFVGVVATSAAVTFYLARL